MKRTTVHWLSPNNLTLLELQTSHLASLRLRVAIAAETFSRSGFSVTFGEFIPTRIDVLFVPKIGADNISTRAPLWLYLIRQARSLGAKVILDYTDHHLGFASPMTAFYSEAITLTDVVIVPSAAMQQNLSLVANIRSTIIRDTVEYSIQAPRRKPNKKARLIWFGHGSNLQFLLSFLSSHDLRKCSEQLAIVTSVEAINWIAGHAKKLLPPSTQLIPWSRESLLQAALGADLAILPLGIYDPRKSGASSNRLITALTLGLPVVTHSLLSYRDYREFFTDLEEDDYAAVIDAPWTEHPKVLRAQETIVPRYMPARVSQEWAHLLSNLLS